MCFIEERVCWCRILFYVCVSVCSVCVQEGAKQKREEASGTRVGLDWCEDWGCLEDKSTVNS